MLASSGGTLLPWRMLLLSIRYSSLVDIPLSEYRLEIEIGHRWSRTQRETDWECTKVRINHF